MNTSGDAAEQVVRLSLEGMEVAAKITGSAAKEVAALLYAALKNRDKNKIKGRQRLTSMLRSGKELTIFTVKNKDMARFVADAKRYGVVYCVLREAKDNPHGVSEIMVRAEDAAKINRIVENIKIATVSDPEVIRENAETGRDKNNAAGYDQEHDRDIDHWILDITGKGRIQVVVRSQNVKPRVAKGGDGVKYRHPDPAPSVVPAKHRQHGKRADQFDQKCSPQDEPCQPDDSPHFRR